MHLERLYVSPRQVLSRCLEPYVGSTAVYSHEGARASPVASQQTRLWKPEKVPCHYMIHGTCVSALVESKMLFEKKATSFNTARDKIRY